MPGIAVNRGGAAQRAFAHLAVDLPFVILRCATARPGLTLSIAARRVD
jgi:hypothetical protein